MWLCYQWNFQFHEFSPNRTYNTGWTRVGLCPKFLVFTEICDISLTSVKFPGISRFSRQVVKLQKTPAMKETKTNGFCLKTISNSSSSCSLLDISAFTCQKPYLNFYLFVKIYFIIHSYKKCNTTICTSSSSKILMWYRHFWHRPLEPPKSGIANGPKWLLKVKGKGKSCQFV